MNRLWILGFTCLLWAPSAWGATQIYVESVAINGDKEVEVFFIQEGKIRYGIGDTSAGTYSVFHSDKETIFVVMRERASYFEMNEDIAARRVVEQEPAISMEMIRESSKKEIEELPVEYRAEVKAKIEAMVAERLKSSQRRISYPEIRFVKTKKKKKIRGYRCKVVNILKDGMSIHELCVSPPKKLGIPKDDFQTLKELARIGASVGRELPFVRGSEPSAWLSEVDGVSVESISHMENSKVRFIQQITHEELPSEYFEVPEKFDYRPMFTAH